MNNPNNTAEAVPSLSDAEAMCQRLEAVESAGDELGTDACTNSYRNPDGPEAAAFIRSLQQRNAVLTDALKALRLQALQGDLNDPANEYGYEALQMANAALASVKGEEE